MYVCIISMCTYLNTQAYIHIYNDLGTCAGAPLRLIVVVCEAPATPGTPSTLRARLRSAAAAVRVSLFVWRCNFVHLFRSTVKRAVYFSRFV